MKAIYTAVAATVVLCSCATTPQVPYRVPQITIVGAKSEQVKLPIIQACISGGGSIEVSTEHQVICAKPMDDSFGSLMYRALATPQYSTNPVGRARYTISETGGSVFVTVDTYLQHENAFGQTSTTPIRNGNLAAQAQAMLERIKASIESAPSVTPSTTTAPAAPQRSAPQDGSENKTTTPAPPAAPSNWRRWGQKDK